MDHQTSYYQKVKNTCWMINQSPGGGGNLLAMSHGPSAAAPLILRRTAAIGDALCASVVADKLIDQGFEVVMQSHPDIHCVLRRHPRLYDVTVPGGFCHINLDGVYEDDPNRRFKHFHSMFMAAAGQQLLARGIVLGNPINCKPRIGVGDNSRSAVSQRLSQYPKPWVFICPRSDSYNVRQVPDGIWNDAATKINGTKFWIGRHPGPPNCVDMHCRHFDNVIELLSAADLLVTVDTGPLHVAAALGVPCVAIGQSSSPELHLNDQNDFVTISPKLDCLNCQQNICPKNHHLPPCQNLDPDFIAIWVNARLRSLYSEDVSAVISIYRPEVDVLNQCLTQVVDQVSEVLVCYDTAGRLPQGALQHPRVRYIQKMANDIGYGKKQNFCARHTNGKYLLLLNDDVFLAPDAVQKMKDCMTDGVAMVSNLLRYPDGTIYHAGKSRAPGMRGWGHIDHKKHLPTITNPTEMENVCGACVMIRRKAFFEVDGFDEEFYLYAEDDDMALKLRRAGWKIMYTPWSTGVHMEHQSTQKTGNIMDYVNKSNLVFDRKWSRYLTHNLNRIPGNFAYD